MKLSRTRSGVVRDSPLPTTSSVRSGRLASTEGRTSTAGIPGKAATRPGWSSTTEVSDLPVAANSTGTDIRDGDYLVRADDSRPEAPDLG